MQHKAVTKLNCPLLFQTGVSQQPTSGTSCDNKEWLTVPVITCSTTEGTEL